MLFFFWGVQLDDQLESLRGNTSFPGSCTLEERVLGTLTVSHSVQVNGTTCLPSPQTNVRADGVHLLPTIAHPTTGV